LNPATQGLVHFSIVADPLQPNLVYVGGDGQPSQVNQPNFSGTLTRIGGRLFRGDAFLPSGLQLQWTPIVGRFADPDGLGPLPGTAPHPDSRAMVFDKNGNILEADDGGIYRLINPTSLTGHWESVIGNLALTEFYSVAFD